MDEQWKDVPGYDGRYQVSDHARVRSLPRKNVAHERILKPALVRGGYCIVALSKRGKIKTKLTHRLLLESFVGPCPNGMEAMHLDGDSSNNCLDNLMWGTPEENYRDRNLYGKLLRGERNHKAKLCELDVWLIRNCDITGAQASEFFDIDHSQISRIRARKSWRHVA